MTFLEEVKEELFNLRVKKDCCMQSEIRGILTFGGAEYQGGWLFGTDSFLLAKRLGSFLKRVCHIDFEERLDAEAESYKFFIQRDILDMLRLKIENGMIHEAENQEKDYCCMRAFIRGAFLASGSAANPERAYRVEIFSENEAAAEKVLDILHGFSVEAKKAKRKNLFVIYANVSEAASDMLKVTEATGAVFKMLEAKVKKERRNDTNRLINCDMANIDRANENSRRETEAIRLIEKKAGLDSLKPKLREAALLRLENEGASLMELTQLSPVPIAKSTLNNRLNKLIEIAKELSD